MIKIMKANPTLYVMRERIRKGCTHPIRQSQGLDFVPSRENHIWFSPDSFARIN